MSIRKHVKLHRCVNRIWIHCPQGCVPVAPVANHISSSQLSFQVELRGEREGAIRTCISGQGYICCISCSLYFLIVLPQKVANQSGKTCHNLLLSFEPAAWSTEAHSPICPQAIRLHMHVCKKQKQREGSAPIVLHNYT